MRRVAFQRFDDRSCSFSHKVGLSNNRLEHVAQAVDRKASFTMVWALRLKGYLKEKSHAEAPDLLKGVRKGCPCVCGAGDLAWAPKP